MINRKTISIAAGVLLVHLVLREQRKKQPTIHVVDKLPLNFNALTIPPIGIYITKEQSGNIDLLNHEMVHWRQYQSMGLLPYYYNFIRGYAVNGYDLHPMEQEARSNESDFCKTNYIECVRTGQAKTVKNPLFRKLA